MLLGALLATATVLVANCCDAAVHERDWKTPGDGLLTYDDVNRREWLDLPQSALIQFPEPRLENAIAELTPGGRFEGFHWATSDDVIALAESADIDIEGHHSINESIDETTSLIKLLGPSDDYGFEAKGVINQMLVDPIDARPWPHAAFAVERSLSNSPRFAVLLFYEDIPTLSTGLMLYRTVPEPSSLVLLVTAWATLTYRHRRRE